MDHNLIVKAGTARGRVVRNRTVYGAHVNEGSLFKADKSDTVVPAIALSLQGRGQIVGIAFNRDHFPILIANRGIGFSSFSQAEVAWIRQFDKSLGYLEGLQDGKNSIRGAIVTPAAELLVLKDNVGTTGKQELGIFKDHSYFPITTCVHSSTGAMCWTHEAGSPKELVMVAEGGKNLIVFKYNPSNGTFGEPILWPIFLDGVVTDVASDVTGRIFATLVKENGPGQIALLGLGTDGYQPTNTCELPGKSPSALVFTGEGGKSHITYNGNESCPFSGAVQELDLSEAFKATIQGSFPYRSSL